MNYRHPGLASPLLGALGHPSCQKPCPSDLEVVDFTVYVRARGPRVKVFALMSRSTHNTADRLRINTRVGSAVFTSASNALITLAAFFVIIMTLSGLAARRWQAASLARRRLVCFSCTAAVFPQSLRHLPRDECSVSGAIVT